jgi:CheY-like chemotaxis protein
MRDSNSNTAKRIVVVDDNEDVCAFIGAALKSAGYEVESVHDGARAFDLLRNRAADLLITDLFMPGQQGFETITRCKAEFPQIRIMVISAGTVPGMQHDFLGTASVLGVAATLRKPFDVDALLDAVRRALQ